MTLEKARADLRAFKMTITKKGTEYRVNFLGGVEATAYYTDDISDAVDTAYLMSKQKEASTT